MIEGRVTEEREPIIDIELRGRRRRRRTRQAVLDTGFNGALTLPLAMLADDSEIRFSVYMVQIRWDGQWRSILAECSGLTPLVGMELLDGYTLHLRGSIGGLVTIEPST
jgi:predicted aspartyl protease